jgi:flagellar basal-body rod modification protein FlgD
MTITSTTATTGSNLLASLGLTGTSTSSSSAAGNAAASAAASALPSLNEQDFLQLMTAQLQDQDPLNPVSNSDFFSQIAQFSTVSGVNQLNSSFSTLASQLTSSQSVQAASLVGHSVLVPASQGQLGSSGISGAVQTSSSGDVALQIRNSAGAVVSTVDLGQQAAGSVPFSWNGKDASGNALAAGAYSFSAQVINGSTAQAATTDLNAVVQSVSLAASGITLNLQGGGSVPFSSVLQVS